ncbi:MAG: M23 family metallopeptidase [Spirochaetales bacterium]|nr:M23 family metallopeptidase [Spirochaetales bacterium]
MNNAWHSGIHIPVSGGKSEAISPLLDGKVVAYRFTPTYGGVSLPEEITKKDYKNLSKKDQALYTPYDWEDSFIKASLSIYKCTETEPPQAYITKNFVLTRHEIILPQRDEPVYFFLLYTNLRPDKYSQSSMNFSEYTLLGESLTEITPFYRKWRFKLNSDHIQVKSYSYKCSVSNIFPYSQFELDDENSLLLEFAHQTSCTVTFENGGSCTVPQSDVDLKYDGVKLKPGADGAYLYRKSTESIDVIDKNRIVKIKADAELQLDTSRRTLGWPYQQGYVPVILRQEHIEASNMDISGWVVKNKFTSYYSPNPELLKKDPEEEHNHLFFYHAETYTGDSVYKIVGFVEYLNSLNGHAKISSADNSLLSSGGFVTGYTPLTDKDDAGTEVTDGNLKIVLLSPEYNHFDMHQEQAESYAFFIESSQTRVKGEVANAALFNDLKKISGSVLAVKFTTQFECDDFEKFQSVTPPGDKAISGIEGEFVYVNYYIQSSLQVQTMGLVKAEDMDFVTKPQGRIKETNAIPAERRTLNESTLIVYESPGSDGEFSVDTGNAREQLGGDSVFFIKEYHQLLHEAKTGFFEIVIDDEEGLRLGYIYLNSLFQLLGLSVWEGDHTEIAGSTSWVADGEIHYPNSDIRHYQSLGCAGHNEQGGSPYYDVALFFKDHTFLNESVGDHPIDTYMIPPEEPLYTIKKPETKDFFFPFGTVFSIDTAATKEALGRKAYKLSLKSMPVFIYNHGTNDPMPDQVNQNETYSMTSIPRIYCFYTSVIKLDESGNWVSCDNTHLEFIKEALESIAPNLEGQSFEVVKIISDRSGDRTPKIMLDFSTTATEFWVDGGNLPPHLQKEGDTFKVKDNGNIGLYESCPMVGKLGPMNQSYSLIYENTFRAPSEGMYDENDQLYYGFRRGGETFFMTSDRAEYTGEGDEDRGIKRNLLEWLDYFILQDQDNDQDLFCDLKNEVLKVIEKVPDENENLVDGWPNGRLKRGELLNLYKNTENEANAKAISRLRKLICKHPLEWNSELYSTIKDDLNRFMGFGACNDNREAYLQSVAGYQDIWAGIKSLEHIDEQMLLYFAHPVTFIDHLERCGLIDMNPYYGKGVSSSAGNGDLRARTTPRVQSNPGFAPQCNASDYKYDGQSYGYITSLFNIPRNNSAGNEYRHGGVDFGSDGESKPIISFIYGKIWAYTWSNIYGNVMIIKGLGAYSDKLYLLAHLDDKIKNVNNFVAPGEQVAMTGTTGNSTGIHLHLEVRMCEQERRDLILDATSFSGVPESKLKWNVEEVTEYGPPKVNPFNHGEPHYFDYWSIGE